MNPLLPALVISLCGLSQALATIEEDEALIAKDLEALHDAREDIREKAATELRSVIARHPSGTSDLRHQDSGETAWKEKLSRIHPGMTWDEMIGLLGQPIETSLVPTVVGRETTAQCRFDIHWVIELAVASPATYEDTLRRYESRISYGLHPAEPYYTSKGATAIPNDYLLLGFPRLLKSEEEVVVELPVHFAGFTGTWTTW